MAIRTLPELTGKLRWNLPVRRMIIQDVYSGKVLLRYEVLTEE